MRALVTGGTGFIGSHLVEALLARDMDVRCLVRDPGRPGWLEGLDVELVRGDCVDPGSLGGVAGGMDYVFHAAGITKASRAKEYYEVNGEGVRNMAGAAAKAGGIRKFVYVSSQAAAGPSRYGAPRKEDDEPEPVSDYGKSKLVGEKYSLGLKGSLPLIIVRPPSVYGPRDRDVYTFFRLVSRGVRTAFREPRMVSVCYVKDLVEGILKAAFADTKSGETFFIADPAPYSWDYMGVALAGALGVKARRLVVPVPVLSMVALFMEAAGMLTRRPVLLNRQKVAEIKERSWVVDTSRAKERLGFVAATPFRKGAAETAVWYRGQGWL